jgi:FAD/FMN-containing dehydrogenase
MVYVSRNDALPFGRIARSPQRVAGPRFRDELPRLLAERPGGSVLAIGLQRSYGDTVQNGGGGLICMAGLDRLIAFDAMKGRLRADAGVTLGDIMKLAVPRGFFVPVSPGTRSVTLAGAIANDVHGKNHHRAGTFGCHVTRIGLLRSDGARAEIGPQDELFAATVGGLGLTGIIEWAEIDLCPIGSAFLDVDTLPYARLSEFWQLDAETAATHEHSVAWIDCAAARGIFTRANWRSDADLTPHDDRRRLRVPFDLPHSALNGRVIGLFNRAYYAVHKRKAGTRRQHYGPFLHPLDAIADWNRLYGRAGFRQYQCVLPTATMRDAIAALIKEISRSGEGSFLTVLKTFGAVPSPGLLSFPMAGATLALDFRNRGAATLRLFERLDAIVRAAEGRLYAAKDGRIPVEMWRRGYPKLERFIPHVDPAFASDFWRHVGA